MQRRDVALGALPAVVAVVVVDADVRDVVLAEHAHEPAREGRLAGRRVADDAEDDRPAHGRLAHIAPRAGVVVVLGLAILGEDAARRMSSGVIVISSSRVSSPSRSAKRRFACRSRARSIELRTLRPWAKRGRVHAPLEVGAERLLGARAEDVVLRGPASGARSAISSSTS